MSMKETDYNKAENSVRKALKTMDVSTLDAVMYLFTGMSFFLDISNRNQIFYDIILREMQKNDRVKDQIANSLNFIEHLSKTYFKDIKKQQDKEVENEKN